jgi:DNA primase
LRAITSAAARFFAHQLADSWVSGYLVGRGFRPEVWRHWCIGYAPASWTALTVHLRGLGFADQAIQAAGLAKRSARGALIDVFRDRVMFGVQAQDGSVAGFIGRAPPSAERNGPVYLNTATTALYRKGQLLFGLYEAGPALAAGARPVLTEGPLDAIAITAASQTRAHAGQPHTRTRHVGLAPCGTALTPDQVRLLARADCPSRGVVVAFDADPAGRGAAVRAYRLLRDITGELWMVSLPPGADPAGYFRDYGATALAALLDAPVPLADLVIDARVAKFDRWLRFTDGTFAALRSVAPMIAGLPPHQVARQVARVASQLGLSYAEVTGAVTSVLPAVLDRPGPNGSRLISKERR